MVYAMRVLKFNVPNLHKDNAQEFEATALSSPGVKQVDTWTGRAEFVLDEATNQSAIMTALRAKGFTLSLVEQLPAPTVVTKVHIDGMTCRSCEITIERKLKKLRTP